jgi:hypothetical protein
MTTTAPPERLLLSWLEEYFAKVSPPDPGWVWQCSASELRNFLSSPQHPWAEEACRVLTSAQATGIYLQHLQQILPHRFRRIRRTNDNFWQIKPPTKRAAGSSRENKAEAQTPTDRS